MVVKTYRLTSSSNSCSVAIFFSFSGFGFLITAVGAVSSLLNQSDNSGLLAKSSISSCCIARAMNCISQIFFHFAGNSDAYQP